MLTLTTDNTKDAAAFVLSVYCIYVWRLIWLGNSCKMLTKHSVKQAKQQYDLPHILLKLFCTLRNMPYKFRYQLNSK